MIALSLFEVKVHSDGERCRRFEVEEGVEAMGFAVRDETYVGSGERGAAEVIDESGDDTFAEAALLVFWVDGDVYDLEEEPPSPTMRPMPTASPSLRMTTA